MKRLRIVGATLGGVLFALAASAQHPGMKPGMTHEQHLAQIQKEAEMKRRGADAMGFDQEKTTHHFHLTANGGLISVAANSADDEASREQIREHLKAIAVEFERGNFGKPVATHAERPPGVETMQRLKSAIRYAFEERPAGGSVRLTTSDPSALTAIHAFLRYQITEHATGDPLSVQP